MIEIPKNPFRLEELRSTLSKSRKYKKLKMLYQKEHPEIVDMNSPQAWDSLNKRPFLSKDQNPMGYERLVIATSLIRANNIKVLNVGFGTGDLEECVFIKRHKMDNLEWYGVDISPVSVKRASKMYPKGSFQTGEIEKLKFEGNTFDFVVVLEVLEHIIPSKIFRSLKEVRRVLKKRGKLIISVPLNEGLEQMVKDGLNVNLHTRVYTPELIEAELKISGLKVIFKKTFFAFRNFYKLKTIIARYVFPGFRKPNNIILMAEKK